MILSACSFDGAAANRIMSLAGVTALALAVSEPRDSLLILPWALLACPSFQLQPARSPTASPIVQAFTALHLPAPVFLGPTATLWSIANISTWEFTGYNMIIFYSALQSIPQEIYESGRLDGLSETGIALRLKLPLIVPALILGVLFSIVGALQLFNEPIILKNLTGSAITTSYTPNIFAFNVAVVNTDFNYGGAIAVILGVITFAFSFGFLRLTRGRLGV